MEPSKIDDTFQHLQSKNRKLILAVIFAVKLVGSVQFLNFSIVLLTDIQTFQSVSLMSTGKKIDNIV